MAPTAVAVTLPRPAEGPVPEGGELVFGARASSAGLPLYGAPPAQRAPCEVRRTGSRLGAPGGLLHVVRGGVPFQEPLLHYVRHGGSHPRVSVD